MTLLIIIVAMSSPLCAAAELCDPMRPPSGYVAAAPVLKVKGSAEKVWVLQSVMKGSDRAVAVVNGVPVSLGEKYQGATLVKILDDEVEFHARNGRKIFLRMTPNIHIKKVSADTEKN
jgi:MSHA biogenesis protein MshK